jgi:hypothetical protein
VSGNHLAGMTMKLLKIIIKGRNRLSLYDSGFRALDIRPEGTNILSSGLSFMPEQSLGMTKIVIGFQTG